VARFSKIKAHIIFYSLTAQIPDESYMKGISNKKLRFKERFELQSTNIIKETQS
jgi:hypothetical protein